MLRIGDKNVLFSGKSMSLISFRIDGTSYQAEEGMTWGEWVESNYNQSFLKYHDSFVVNNTGEFVNDTDGIDIGFGDLIRYNAYYKTIDYSNDKMPIFIKMSGEGHWATISIYSSYGRRSFVDLPADLEDLISMNPELEVCIAEAQENLPDIIHTATINQFFYLCLDITDSSTDITIAAEEYQTYSNFEAYLFVDGQWVFLKVIREDNYEIIIKDVIEGPIAIAAY